MHFASDNTGPAHPSVMQAMMEANEGYMLPYGADPVMAEVTERLRATFEAPEAAVYLVATGTSANALALATLCEPWQTIFCSRLAHIQEDECNAPEFFTGGAKLTLVGQGDKMSVSELRRAISGEETRGVHGPQRGAVGLTNVTERGQLYSLEDIRALGGLAKEFALPVHLDGARFANAIAATNASPAEMTWRAGVDAVSFGGTKNGLLGVEAVIFFDPGHAQQFEYRRKRAGHLFSKHRYLSAQMLAYLRDDLWRNLGAQANAKAAYLVAALECLPDVHFDTVPQANMVFCSFPRHLHQRLHAVGAAYNIWSGTLSGEDPDELLEARLVCDWSISHELIDRFVDVLKTG
ncbi:threonine aldolase family protein [Primorskyibacter sp. S187A]|uniref:threonine aldolase family protein n=1 Tax=Primorskyibacter sp. S187A TaxID=3415130 RepID=UPI003C7A44A0